LLTSLRRRKLVNKGFTPQRVRAQRDRVRAVVDGLVDAVCERGECDFVWDIAAPLPLLMIAALLGFDEDTYDDLLRWSDDLMRATTLEPSTEIQMLGYQAMVGFRELQMRVIEERRAEPRDDLISTLCAAEIEGHRLDDESEGDIICGHLMPWDKAGPSSFETPASGGLLRMRKQRLRCPADFLILRSRAMHGVSKDEGHGRCSVGSMRRAQ